MWEFVLGAFIFFLGIVMGATIRPIIVQTEEDKTNGN